MAHDAVCEFMADDECQLVIVGREIDHRGVDYHVLAIGMGVEPFFRRVQNHGEAALLGSHVGTDSFRSFLHPVGNGLQASFQHGGFSGCVVFLVVEAALVCRF